MRKFLLIGITLLLLLLVALIGVAAYNANSLLSHFKPQLEKVASDALGSSVTLGKLDVSIFPAAKIIVHELTLKEKGESFTLHDLELRLRLMSLIFGKVEITKLKVSRPRLTVVKDGNAYAIAGLPTARGDQPAKVSNERIQADHKSAVPAVKEGGLAIALQELAVEDAALFLKDKGSGNEFELATLSLNSALALQSGEMHAPKFSVLGKVLSSGSLQASGSIAHMGGSNATLSLAGTFSKLSQEKVVQLLALVTPSLPVTLKGESSLNFSVDGPLNSPKITFSLGLADTALKKEGVFEKQAGTELSVSFESQSLTPPRAAGQSKISLARLELLGLGTYLANLQGTLQLDLGAHRSTAKGEEISVELGGVPVKLDVAALIEPKRGEISDFKLRGFSGKGQGSASLSLENFGFTNRFHGESLALEALFRALKPSADPLLVGTLTRTEIDLKGALGEKLTSSLQGVIELEIKDGELRGSNLAGDVLKAVTSLPFLSGSLYSSVPKENSSTVSSNNTAIQKFSASFTVKDSKLHTKDLHLVSTIFSLDAQGSLGFDTSVDLDASIAFSPQFSKSLVSTTKELKALLDREERLIIPLTLTGVPPKIVVLPNVSALAKTVGKRAITEKLGDVLGDALKGGKGKGLGGLLGF